MIYFTRQLLKEQQGDPSLQNNIEVENKWKMAIENYQRHFNSVESSLPVSVQKLSRMSLHDGVIIDISKKEREITIVIDSSSNYEEQSNEIKLIFKGVEFFNGIDNIINEWWLYEEYYLSKIGRFELNVLLTNSEFTIIADEVEIIRN
ncbi:MAG: DUF4085 domain-containing protein [Candidatus Omnitrophica bacterium]|nr:DUF4085 domain-containing protein [Candidatus Omnitrophota bacterium]